MTLASKITLLRVVFIPVYMVLMYLSGGCANYWMWIALGVFILASLTDFVDGYIARHYNQITNFGKFLDPIADKVLTTSALLAFMSMGLCNIWIVMIVLTREFAIASVRMIAASNGVVIPANIWDQIKTVTQMVFTITIMLMGEAWELVAQADAELSAKLPDLSLVSNGLLWITAVFTVVSGVIYLIDSRKIIDYTK